MLITIDTTEDTEADIRAVIGFLAHVFKLEPSGFDGGTDGDFEPVPGGTTVPKGIAPAAVTAADAGVATGAAAVTPANAQTVSNVLHFPVPPPPPALAGSSFAATVDVIPVSPPPAPTAAVVLTVASATPEYDSAGMPWDARIHQKGKTQKKDRTWKLQKGIDPTIVQSVVAELSARKIATQQSPSVAPDSNRQTTLTPPQLAVPPPPPPVTLPPGPLLPYDGNTVPLPPVPSDTAATHVPPPPVPAAVPVPPVAPAGSMGVTYRSLIDKMTAGNKAGTLTAMKVLEIVTSCGGPNLQQLNQMPQIWADVDAKLDLVLAGLM